MKNKLTAISASLALVFCHAASANVLPAYQTTDFADIGDDHTDPFLTDMVHQGFIEHGSDGVYHAPHNH